MPIDDSIIDQETAEKRQMWRRLRSAITLLVLVVIVIVGAWVSWRNISSDATTDGAGSGPTCAPTVAENAPKPGSIEVNVYNATSRDGLAAKVSKSLRKRGFVVGDVANDPLNRSVEAAAEVRSNLDRQGAASVVMTHVSGAEFVSDNRTTKSVDFVIGDDFNGLLPRKQVNAGAQSTLPPCDSATN